MTAAAASDVARIVVVDDSAVQRRFLRAAVDAAADLSVVGEARNGKEAVALVARLRPAAVLMDLDLPVMSGIEAIERIMAASPTPILVYSGHIQGADSANALEALAAGAVDVMAKPGADDKSTLDEHAALLRKRLRVAARVRVITHPRGRLRSKGLATGPVQQQPPQAHGQPASRASAPPVVTEDQVRREAKLIVIGASTGGPQALHTVLKDLPADLQQAVLVVQHMAEGFIPGLVSWLDQLVPMQVVQGQTGQRLSPGTITIAPSGSNLLVDDRLRVTCVPPEAGQFHVPGIDQCMVSVADALGPDAIGVLLTGMGRDGAAGLKAMRDRGALTIGQDEATSTVYGMPQAAAALDAVDKQVGVHEVAPVLLALVGRA